MNVIFLADNGGGFYLIYKWIELKAFVHCEGAFVSWWILLIRKRNYEVHTKTTTSHRWDMQSWVKQCKKKEKASNGVCIGYSSCILNILISI